MKTMAVHFDPYFDEDSEKTPCGVYYSIYGVGNTDSTNNWDEVTCKRCLKSKDKLQKWFKETEEFIIKQYGELADFMSEVKDA